METYRASLNRRYYDEDDLTTELEILSDLLQNIHDIHTFLSEILNPSRSNTYTDNDFIEIKNRIQKFIDNIYPVINIK